MQQLSIFQSLWGMESLPGQRGSWSIEEQLYHIAEEGFDGVNFEDDNHQAARIADLARELGLGWSLTTFPSTVADLRTATDLVERLGPESCDHVNLQPDVRPVTVLEGIPYVLGWLDAAQEAGVMLLIETHRDRMTTDLHYTLQLIEAVPSMRLTADLSHFVVGREFRWPVGEEYESQILRILDRTHAFHGRVASREQVQVQIGFPQQRPWVDLFLSWWKEGFRRWRARSGPDATLNFLVELGPPSYAMTGPDGEELSDRWEEALALKGMVRQIWDQSSRAATN